MATLPSYKIKIATLAIVLIVAIANTANADIVKDFGNSLGITYAEADYRVHSNGIVIKNAQYKGFLLGQVTINNAKQSSIEILGIKKGSLSIAYLKAELGSLSALFDTIPALMAAVQAGLSEERYMAEERTMCEGDYDSDDSCIDGEIISYEVHNKTWALNITDLFEIAKGLGLTSLSIGGVRSDTFSLDSLKLAKLDTQSWLTDLSLRGLTYKKTARSVFRSEFKSLDFKLDSLALERVDFISFVHFLAEATKTGITYREPRWYMLYPERFAPYFVYAPFTAKAVKNLDATIVEEGVSVRLYNASSSDAMVRGDAITESNIKFSLHVEAAPESFKSAAIQDVYRYNGGKLDITVAQKRKLNTSDKNNPLYESYANNNRYMQLLDESLKITAPKHFEIEADITYPIWHKNAGSAGGGFGATRREFNLDNVVFSNVLLQNEGHGNYAVKLQFDNFIPLIEQAGKLREMQASKAIFRYNDKGMVAAIAQTPKFNFTVPKSMKATENGEAAYALLQAFMDNPLKLVIYFTAKRGDAVGIDRINTSTFWTRGHLIKFSANGATITLE